jgi:DNA repair protein RadC
MQNFDNRCMPPSNSKSTTKAERKSQTSTSARYERYRTVVDFVATQCEFSVDAVKQNFPAEQPAFVTRLVNELVAQGWLVRESDEGTYSWNAGRGPFSATRWLDDKVFGTQITVAPEQERPRERLLAHGADQLRTSELIAILIRSGRPGESAVQAGEKLARKFANRLEDLPHAGRGELKAISSAVEKTAYCQIMAGIELGRRVAAVSDDKITTKIGGTSDAVAFCQQHFARLTDAKQEEFHIVTLNTKNHVIDTHQITVGTLDASLVHPREVFSAAIKDAASSIILVHNHPSGDPSPSREDRAVTSRLEEAGKLIGIDVLDHIIVARQASVSIRECG